MNSTLNLKLVIWGWLLTSNLKVFATAADSDKPQTGENLSLASPNPLETPAHNQTESEFPSVPKELHQAPFDSNTFPSDDTSKDHNAVPLQMVSREQLNQLIKSPGFKFNQNSHFKRRGTNSPTTYLSLEAAFNLSLDHQITYQKIAQINLEFAASPQTSARLISGKFLGYEKRTLSQDQVLFQNTLLNLNYDSLLKLGSVHYWQQELAYVLHFPPENNPYFGKSYSMIFAGWSISGILRPDQTFFVSFPVGLETRLQVFDFPHESALSIILQKRFYGLNFYQEDEAGLKFHWSKTPPNSRWTLGLTLGVFYQSLQKMSPAVRQSDLLWMQTGLRFWFI